MSNYKMCVSYGLVSEGTGMLAPFVATKNMVIDYTFEDIDYSNFKKIHHDTDVRDMGELTLQEGEISNPVAQFKLNRFRALDNTKVIVISVTTSRTEFITKTMLRRVKQIRKAFPKQSIAIIFAINKEMIDSFGMDKFMASFDVKVGHEGIVNLSDLGFTYKKPFTELSDSQIAESLGVSIH